MIMASDLRMDCRIFHFSQLLLLFHFIKMLLVGLMLIQDVECLSEFIVMSTIEKHVVSHSLPLIDRNENIP